MKAPGEAVYYFMDDQPDAGTLPLPPADWWRMDACFRDLLREVYEEGTSNLQIDPHAMDAVRRSHQPYRDADGVYMDLMKLPRGMGRRCPGARGTPLTQTEVEDWSFFIRGVMLIIVHDTVPDASVLHEMTHNMLEFYSRRLGTLFCTWSFRMPSKHGDPVQIRRLPR